MRQETIWSEVFQYGKLLLLFCHSPQSEAAVTDATVDVRKSCLHMDRVSGTLSINKQSIMIMYDEHSAKKINR